MVCLGCVALDAKNRRQIVFCLLLRGGGQRTLFKAQSEEREMGGNLWTPSLPRVATRSAFPLHNNRCRLHRVSLPSAEIRALLATAGRRGEETDELLLHQGFWRP